MKLKIKLLWALIVIIILLGFAFEGHMFSECLKDGRKMYECAAIMRSRSTMMIWERK